MRIVVTGASGNIGTALLRRLSVSGIHQLVGVARRPPPRVPPYEGVRWVSTDLSEPWSEATLTAAVRGADVVVHLAWAFQPSHDIGYLERLGVGGTERVAAAVRDAAVPHLVHLSSIGAYSAKVDDVPVAEGWPTQGIASSPYSRHKAAAERVLDVLEGRADAPVVTRMRPGIVGQRAAGSELLRYGVPALVPAGVLRHLPVLPLDRRLAVPVVHADDVADAVARAVDRRLGGAFNLAAATPATSPLVAAAFGARAVHVPARALRTVVSMTWHARLQQVDPGWLDLAYTVPLLDTRRAREQLGWAPTADARDVLDEVVEGLQEAASGTSAPLRQRTVRSEAQRLLRRGPVSHRPEP
jgi:UDP-glucose 4-epimerase